MSIAKYGAELLVIIALGFCSSSALAQGQGVTHGATDSNKQVEIIRPDNGSVGFDSKGNQYIFPQGGNVGYGSGGTSVITPQQQPSASSQPSSYEAELAEYDRLIQKDPTNAIIFANDVLNNRNFIYAEKLYVEILQQRNEKRTSLTKDQQGQVCIGLAQTYFMLDRLEAAITYYKVAQTYKPNDPVIKGMIIELENRLATRKQ